MQDSSHYLRYSVSRLTQTFPATLSYCNSTLNRYSPRKGERESEELRGIQGERQVRKRERE